MKSTNKTLFKKPSFFGKINDRITRKMTELNSESKNDKKKMEYKKTLIKNRHLFFG